jgi:nucleotide-binding universal stress UspA family protein
VSSFVSHELSIAWKNRERLDMTIVEPEPVKKSTVLTRKILVAVDLTEHSKLTISYAVQIAKCLNASIVLMHVFAPEALTEFPKEYRYQLVEELHRDREMRLMNFSDAVRDMKVTCNPVSVIGDPAERIAAMARAINADLIITASHHPKFLARLFNLDTAPQIMHRAPCPVLIYHGENA